MIHEKRASIFPETSEELIFTQTARKIRQEDGMKVHGDSSVHLQDALMKWELRPETEIATSGLGSQTKNEEAAAAMGQFKAVTKNSIIREGGERWRGPSGANRYRRDE